MDRELIFGWVVLATNPHTNAVARSFLRHHLFYSGLLPLSHIPHIQYWTAYWVLIVRVGGS